jgi:hypothetical protein
MQRRIVDGPAPLDLGTPSNTAGNAVRWIAIGTFIAATLVGAVGLGRWSAGWLAIGEEGTATEAPYSTSQVETIPEDVIIVREPAAEPGIEPARAPSPVAVVKRDRRSRTPKAIRRTAAERTPTVSVVKTTTLEAEMRLLARADAAMRAGNPAGSLAMLDEHAREFAAGQLAPEREYKRALALCELGRTDEARAVAAAFVRRHPSSPLRSKALGVCRGLTPTFTTR